MGVTRTSRDWKAAGFVLAFVALVTWVAIFGAKMKSRGHSGERLGRADGIDERMVDFAALAVVDDLKNGANGGDHIFPASSSQERLVWTGISLEVDAKAYEAAYDANEIAADNHYKGKRLLVTGTIASVEKDFTGAGYLNLRGSSFLPGVHAELDQVTMDEAAGFAKGQHIELVCNGAGRVAMIALLNECQTANAYWISRTPVVRARVRDFLSGTLALPTDTAETIAMVYVLGQHLPANSRCLEENRDACARDLEALAKDKDTKKVITEQMKTLLASLKVAAR